MERAGDSQSELAEKINASQIRVRDALGGGDSSMLKRIIRYYTDEEVHTRHYFAHAPKTTDSPDRWNEVELK